ILIITLCIAGLFCAAFVAIALYDDRYGSARWFAAAYAGGMSYALLEFLLPYFADVRIGTFLGHTSFLVTLTLLNVGIARRYDVRLPVLLMTAAFSASLVASAL